MLESVAVGFLVFVGITGISFGILLLSRAFVRMCRMPLYHPTHQELATIPPPPTRRKRHWTPEMRELRWSSVPMLHDQRVDYAMTERPRPDIDDTLPSVDVFVADTIPCPPKEF